MMTCATCRHCEPASAQFTKPGYWEGALACVRLSRADFNEPPAIAAQDDYPWFRVTADFGCTLHEAKP